MAAGGAPSTVTLPGRATRIRGSEEEALTAKAADHPGDPDHPGAVAAVASADLAGAAASVGGLAASVAGAAAEVAGRRLERLNPLFGKRRSYQGFKAFQRVPVVIRIK